MTPIQLSAHPSARPRPGVIPTVVHFRKPTGLARITSLALAAGLAAPFLSAAPAARVEITAELGSAGPRIGPGFAGLSYEAAALLPDRNGRRYFRPDNLPLLTLFRTLGIGSLRIGGNTSDRNAGRLPGKADLDSLFSFAAAAHVKVIYCLRLYGGDPAAAAATAKYVMDRYGSLVDALSIGQEPSAYPGEKPASGPARKYPYSAYRDRWEAFSSEIAAAVPAVRFSGPGVHDNALWARRFMDDFGRSHHVALITEHLYPGGAAGKLPSPEVGRDRLLSPEFSRVYERLYEGFAPQARALGLPYRLEEVNSYYNGGAANASNTFAAALWALDFMRWWAGHGAAGLNFHTGDRVSMNDHVQPPRYAAFMSTPGGFAIRPLSYGIKAFALGGGGRSVPVALAGPAGLDLTVYAVAEGGGTLAFTLVNKEHGPGARDAVAVFPGLQGWSRAKAIFLEARDGDVAATSGIALGGSAIKGDGRWAGSWQPVSPGQQGEPFEVRVPSAAAAIVEFRR